MYKLVEAYFLEAAFIPCLLAEETCGMYIDEHDFLKYYTIAYFNVTVTLKVIGWNLC